MSSYELVHTIVDKGILLHGLDTARVLQLHALHCLEHIHHTFNPESLDAETERAEDTRRPQALPAVGKDVERQRELHGWP